MKPDRLLILLMCATLVACGGEEHKDIQEWMAQQSAGLRGRIPALPEVKIFPVIDFDMEGVTHDPFQAIKIEPDRRAGKGANRPDVSRRREPLEAYPLETLRMVGMMFMNGKPVALVNGDKTLHQVRTGNYLGQNFGVVTKISESEITLKELIEDANGDWNERVSTMQLQEQEAKK